MEWSFEHAMMVRRHGTGPSIVWIHGLGEWSVSFDPITRHPALAGFTHVLPDLPGYGRSPWSAIDDAMGSLEALADHLATWLRAREPAVLVGHSMGGVLATYIAERIPVAGLVNIDGNLSRGDCTFSAQGIAYSLDDFVARGFTDLRGTAYARGATQPALRGYYAALCATNPHAFHRHATDLVRVAETETLAARLAALDVPLLFVAGVPDGICTHSRALLDRHRVRWVGVEPAGHWVFVDQPDAVALHVLALART